MTDERIEHLCEGCDGDGYGTREFRDWLTGELVVEEEECPECTGLGVWFE